MNMNMNLNNCYDIIWYDRNKWQNPDDLLMMFSVISRNQHKKKKQKLLTWINFNYINWILIKNKNLMYI